MKLFVNKIVSEFNKIFAGTKRVGDSLKLEGRRMNELDVANAATLGYKSEATLNVNHAVFSDNGEKLRSIGLDGEPDVDSNGDPIFKTENQLSVHNTQLVRNVEPINLEVDIARRLKVGDQENSPIINVSNLITHPTLYRVKDSGLLGGKPETDLYVRRSRDSDNADLLNNTPQNELVVEKARIATKLTTSDGKELKEEELRVYRTETIRYGTEELNVYGLRDYILNHDNAKDIIPNLSTAAQYITKSGESIGYTFDDIMNHLKNDSESEIYKTKRLITSDSNATVKTTDEYKTWIIASDEFKDKVATLNSKTSDRAVKFGDANESYTLTNFKTYIKENITVNLSTLANNAHKLQNKTVDDLKTEFKTDYFTNAGTTLTDTHINGFFGANKVKLAVQSIKSNNSINSDKLESYSLSEIKEQIKNHGVAQTAKYIYATSSGGQKSYTDITNDITESKASIIGSATNDYDSLGKIETIIKNNKTDIETALDIETTSRTTADNNLQHNIDVEKGRIDEILSGSTNNFNSFGEVKTYIDTQTGTLSNLSTSVKNNLVSAINELNSSIESLEISTSSSNSGTLDKVNNIKNAIGILNDDGTFNTNSMSGIHYLLGATTVYEMSKKLDSALKAEETVRISTDVSLNNRLTAIETKNGDLTTLSTEEKGTIVGAINEVHSEIDTEITNRTNVDAAIQSELDTTQTGAGLNSDGTYTATETANYISDATNLNDADIKLDSALKSEETARISADTTLDNRVTTVETQINGKIGDLTTLTTEEKGTIVDAINEVHSEINSKLSNKLNKDSQLHLDVIFDESFNSNTDTLLAVVGTRYYVDVTSKARTILLPSDAKNFDRILIHGLKGDFTTNNLTISLSSNSTSTTIMGLNEDLIINSNNKTFEFVMINNDWRIL